MRTKTLRKPPTAPHVLLRSARNHARGGSCSECIAIFLCDRRRVTPLVAAVREDRRDAIATLLRLGANPRKETLDGVRSPRKRPPESGPVAVFLSTAQCERSRHPLSAHTGVTDAVLIDSRFESRWHAPAPAGERSGRGGGARFERGAEGVEKTPRACQFFSANSGEDGGWLYSLLERVIGSVACARLANCTFPKRGNADRNSPHSERLFVHTTCASISWPCLFHRR